MLWLHFAGLQCDVVLFAAAALFADDFEKEVSALGWSDAGEELDGLIVVPLGLELALEEHVTGQGAADFDFDRLSGVVADPLGVDFVVVPAGKRGVFHAPLALA